MQVPLSVLRAYHFEGKPLTITLLGSGLINQTWKITYKGNAFILQRINHTVFRQPADIAWNMQQISVYLERNAPEYNFTAPLMASDGGRMVYIPEEGYFRMFRYVPDSHSKDVVQTPEEAYEASVQFGRFSRLLSGFDATTLRITLPYFHDLAYRYNQFKEALKTGSHDRITGSADLISFIEANENIVADFRFITSSAAFKVRVIHHDTKISNVLFNQEGKGLCVIDLDTVMPGYFISDVGDMMRTYLSPVSEEEQDLSKIEVRDDIYKAIVKGYYEEMEAALTDTEKKYFFYSGKFMIYMQAIRFLTDHINNDQYYGARYPGHNLVRAHNQVVLLQRLMEKEAMLANYKPGRPVQQ